MGLDDESSGFSGKDFSESTSELWQLGLSTSPGALRQEGIGFGHACTCHNCDQKHLLSEPEVGGIHLGNSAVIIVLHVHDFVRI